MLKLVLIFYYFSLHAQSDNSAHGLKQRIMTNMGRIITDIIVMCCISFMSYSFYQKSNYEMAVMTAIAIGIVFTIALDRIGKLL